MTKQKQQASHPKETAQPAESLEERLDEALEESFPASDPIAVDVGDAKRSTGDKETSSGGKKRH
ncbi:hypothetical protein [Paraburkholderia fungorum]|uniref:YfhD family protein n=1 Tax=Paraburkholderia fungorum TaxID=134537 RepID=A0AAW3UU88_9BURK|nr:hypothetical protein [Paraburkholderia fungorum]MBB4514284.1 hypothetical protein [Paraburkholderia fungorum]MBB6202174.1 hypothetical protein [Paraburkholderia fungorum]